MRLRRRLTGVLVIEAAFTVGAAVALGAAAASAFPRAGPLWPLLGALAAGCAGAVILGWWVAGTVERPLREIAAAARSGAAGQLHPAADGSYAEGQAAVEAFNAMVRRLAGAMAALGLEKNTLESVIAHMHDALLVLGADGALSLMNPSAERVFGVTARGAVGHRLIEVVHHFELDALVRQVERGRIPLSRELEIHHPDRRLLDVQATPVLGRAGEFLGTVVVAQDLTDLRRTDLVRQEFVANVSHELRTPLTSLRALAETLREGALGDREAGPRFLDRIISEIDRLTLLVNDLLDLSAIETGNARLEMAAIPLSAVAAEVTAKFQPVADRRRIALRAEGLEGLPPAWADEQRLTQAVANLVDNAIKYTSDGGTVTISGQDRDGFVGLSVADTGIGIAAEHLPRIFERFYRVDRSRSREHGGTGLGLSIVKHIATSHGGRVEVQSAEGRGSVFTLWLPHAGVEIDRAVDPGGPRSEAPLPDAFR